jgi:hypothetical protein
VSRLCAWLYGDGPTSTRRVDQRVHQKHAVMSSQISMLGRSSTVWGTIRRGAINYPACDFAPQAKSTSPGSAAMRGTIAAPVMRGPQPGRSTVEAWAEGNVQFERRPALQEQFRVHLRPCRRQLQGRAGSSSLYDVLRADAGASRRIAVVLFGGLAVSVLASLLLARMMTRPIRHLALLRCEPCFRSTVPPTSLRVEARGCFDAPSAGGSTC